MSRALRSGAQRMFSSHGGAAGRWFHAHYAALETRLGPFDDVSRFYASGVAALWVTFQHATRTLETAEGKRMSGKGRRPSASAIASLKKRQGLSWGSYDAALRRLEELAIQRKAHHDPLAEVRRAVAEANQR